LQEKRGSTVVDTYHANGNPALQNIPTAVLINEGSASASEIVAGALHDNHAARLIGTKSYGKGVVQQLKPLSDGAELKVTVASWYRPNGQNINKKGITPDDTVKAGEKDAPRTDSDTQLNAAKMYLNK
jgi:carboxyl-terminal processing protease